MPRCSPRNGMAFFCWKHVGSCASEERLLKSKADEEGFRYVFEASRPSGSRAIVPRHLTLQPIASQISLRFSRFPADRTPRE